MVAFNFVNRVANALGVELEVSPYLHRFRWVRYLLMRVETLGLRSLVDLRPRDLPIRPASENLLRMDALLRTVFDPLPKFFHRLSDAPHLLEVQHGLFYEALKNQGGDLSTFLSIGVVVLDKMPAKELHRAVASWFERCSDCTPQRILSATHDATSKELSLRDRTVLRFARDITCCSDRIDQGRVDQLRCCELTDVQILDLVILTALWNAVIRLELLLREPLEGHREDELSRGNSGLEDSWPVPV
jgi:hypothetical protein